MVKACRRNILALWAALLAVLLGISIGFPYYGFIYLCSTAVAAIFIAAVILLYYNPSPSPRAPKDTPVSAGQEHAAPELPSAQDTMPLLDVHKHSRQSQPTIHIPASSNVTGTSTRPRLYFLDALKTALTALVVVHHVCCAFTGDSWYYNIGNYVQSFQVFGQSVKFINQSYFMCLFFFVSGYFTPSSYAKKGRHEFLKDKFKRLGLPFLAFTLVIMPLLGLMVRKAACGEAQVYDYFPDAGPTWFLAWLLFFNVAYASIGQTSEAPIEMPLPRMSILLLAGVVLTAAQLGLNAGTTNFIYMPITIGSLPFDIAFFAAGVLAQRGCWLDRGLDQLPLVTRVATVAVSVLYIVGVFAVSLVTYMDGGGGSMPSREGPDDDANGRSSPLALMLLAGFSGIFCIFFSLNLLQVFRRYLNFESPVTKYFSNSAYTLYLIHALLVVPLTWSYVEILNARGERIVFALNSTTSSTHLSSDGLIWGGWVYTCVLSLGLGWPLSAYLRTLPGLDKIL